MFQNYFVTALRNILKNPIFSIINIGGLALGLAVCTIVYLYVEREMNFDSWVEDQEGLYRVEIYFNNPVWGEGYMASLQPPLKGVIDESFPEISSSTFIDWGNVSLKRENIVFHEQVVSVSPEFFDLFPLNFIHGDAHSAKRDINTIALSRSLAEKYFGSNNPIGQSLVMAGDREMIVGAVYEDLPGESHLPGDAYVLYNPTDYTDNWNGASPLMYVKIDNPADVGTVLTKLQDIIAEYKPFMDPDTANPTEQFAYILQPFSDVHLMSIGRTASNPYGNLMVIYGYITIAALILGISCINYVNLATTRAAKRTKEVCMRKVLGAGRKALMLQFLGENIVIALIALLIATSAVELALPYVSVLIGGELTLNLSDPGVWTLFTGLIAFCGISAGLYPAVYISGFRPSRFLHSDKSQAGASGPIKNALVVFQFAVATGLIAMAIVIYSQMSHVNTMKLGFDEENLIVLRDLENPLVVDSKYALKAELERIPGVEGVATTFNVPGDSAYTGHDFYLQGAAPDNATHFRIIPSDAEFLPTLDVALLAGRYLSSNRPSDELILPEDGSVISPKVNVVISISALRALGLESAEAAIGKVMMMADGSYAVESTIVGVVEDIYFGASKRTIDSTVYFTNTISQSEMLVRISGSNSSHILNQIDQAWTNMFPATPVRRQFVDDNLDRLTARENVQAKLILGFSTLAILISSMGLLGLAIFSAEQRTKEIGIRKVMGARIKDIVGLLTWQFSKPILLGNLFAIPAAWYFADGWLQGFSQRIDLSLTYFALASVLALLIGWITVAGHAFKVASTNPIHALRYE